MNLNDPRNVIITIPEGFDFDLGEYQKATGCKIDPIEIPLSSVDDLVKIVIQEHEKSGVPIKVENWTPLLFSKTIRLFSGEELTERFSIMALRIKGSLEDDNIKRVVCNKLHPIGPSDNDGSGNSRTKQ